MHSQLQSEANIVIEAKLTQNQFNQRIQDRINAEHELMLKELHVRCEAKKNALREERFWNEVLEESQASDFPY